MSIQSLLLVSLLAGFIGAMSGMGGGIVLIPALTFFGVDIKHAIAASIVSVIATSSGSASAYVRDRITNLKVGMFLEMFTIIGALAGAAITLASGQRLLFILFGIVLLASWGTLFWQRHETWRPDNVQDRFSQWLELEGSYHDQAIGETIHYRAAHAYLGGPLMFGAGLIAGLLGIGAGALKVLIHDLVMRLPPKVSTTTSNLIIGVTALAGAGVYLSAGLIVPAIVAPVILGVVLGAFIGTRLLVKLTNETVRRIFLLVLLILGIERWSGACEESDFDERHTLKKSSNFDMEILVGSILFGGVLLSSSLLAAGLIWNWIMTGRAELDYALARMNFLEFLQAAFREVFSHSLQPRTLIDLGIAALMITPYVRVLASLVYFVFAEHNWKYSLFTAFVFIVLTYSLFQR
jgi:uncharacterized membrane protein YfcA/uncharacterized membrane protein